MVPWPAGRRRPAVRSRDRCVALDSSGGRECGTVPAPGAGCPSTDACDGFVLVPHLTLGGLDRFVGEVVPELQDRGSYRTAYSRGYRHGRIGPCRRRPR